MKLFCDRFQSGKKKEDCKDTKIIIITSNVKKMAEVKIIVYFKSSVWIRSVMAFLASSSLAFDARSSPNKSVKSIGSP